MVLEIAQIDIKPGMEAEFEAGVAKAAPIFKRAKGCTGMELHRSVEKPSRYRLFVECTRGRAYQADRSGVLTTRSLVAETSPAAIGRLL